MKEFLLSMSLQFFFKWLLKIKTMDFCRRAAKNDAMGKLCSQYLKKFQVFEIFNQKVEMFFNITKNFQVFVFVVDGFSKSS